MIRIECKIGRYEKNAFNKAGIKIKTAGVKYISFVIPFLPDFLLEILFLAWSNGPLDGVVRWLCFVAIKAFSTKSR